MEFDASSFVERDFHVLQALPFMRKDVRDQTGGQETHGHESEEGRPYARGHAHDGRCTLFLGRGWDFSACGRAKRSSYGRGQGLPVYLQVQALRACLGRVAREGRSSPGTFGRRDARRAWSRKTVRRDLQRKNRSPDPEVIPESVVPCSDSEEGICERRPEGEGELRAEDAVGRDVPPARDHGDKEGKQGDSSHQDHGDPPSHLRCERLRRIYAQLQERPGPGPFFPNV